LRRDPLCLRRSPKLHETHEDGLSSPNGFVCFVFFVAVVFRRRHSARCSEEVQRLIFITGEAQMTFAAWLVSLALLAPVQQVVVQGGPPPKPVPKDAPTKLPDTPQARHVQAYLDAFNSGDEQKFLTAQERFMAADTLAKRPADQRAQMFRRMRGDFGTLAIKRVAASPEQIRAVMLTKEGEEAIFSFDFEKAPPYRITQIGVDLGNVQR